MADIRVSSLPFKQIITVQPKDRAVIRPYILGAFSKMKISCEVDIGDAVGVAGGAMKLVGALRGKPKETSKQSISDIILSVYTPSGGLFSPDGYSSGWQVTGSRTIEIPIQSTTGEWLVVLDNLESKITQKIVNLTIEEITWKQGPPIQLTIEIPAREMKVISFPVEIKDRIRIKAGVVSSDIDVYLVSQDNVVGNTATVNFAYLKQQKSSGFTEVYECLKNENVSLVLDNRGSKMTAKTVNVSIALESKTSETPTVQAAPTTEVVTSPSTYREIIKETVKEVVLIRCPNCQYKNEEGSSKCSHCGAIL